MMMVWIWCGWRVMEPMEMEAGGSGVGSLVVFRVERDGDNHLAVPVVQVQVSESRVAFAGPDKPAGGQGHQYVVQVVPGTLLGCFADQFLALEGSIAAAVVVVIGFAIYIESQQDQFGLFPVHDLNVQVLVFQKGTRDSPPHPRQVHVVAVVVAIVSGKRRMNVEPRHGVFFPLAVQDTEFDPWVGHSGKGIPVVLLARGIGLPLVHDAVVGDVRLVALLKGHELGIGRDPKSLVSGHFLHGNEIRQAVDDATSCGSTVAGAVVVAGCGRGPGIVRHSAGRRNFAVAVVGVDGGGSHVQFVFAHKGHDRSVVADVGIDDGSRKFRGIDDPYQFVLVLVVVVVAVLGIKGGNGFFR